MSFASFGPLPQPQPNPIPSLPALEAAIRRLEATRIPPPACQQTGAAPSHPASRDAGGTNAGGPGGTALWQVVAALLARMDPDIRSDVQRGFERALEAVAADLALPPEQRQVVPVPFWVQHLGRHCFHKVRLCEQDQRGIDGLLRQALWRAIDALEAAALLPAEREVYLSILAEQCARFAWVYDALVRRGDRCAALWIAQGELKLLRHRGSRAAEQLLFS